MNSRRRLIGVVKSDKMEQTVVVEISRTFRHPLYKKVVHTSKRVKAHDTLGCKVGDEVQIVESRPISADTRFVVESIITKRGEGAAIEIIDTVEIEPEETEPTEVEPAEIEPAEVEPAEIEPDETESDEEEPSDDEPTEGAES